MSWILPEYSRRAVDRAGKTLVSTWMGDGTSRGNVQQALTVLNNWRAAHSFPLNTLQMGLRGRARGYRARRNRITKIEKNTGDNCQATAVFENEAITNARYRGLSCDMTDPAAVRELRHAHQQSRMKHKLV